MSVTASRTSPEQAAKQPRKKTWGWAQYLALLGVPILLLQLWTVTHWAAAGIHIIDEYWSPAWSADWWKARVIELGSLAVAAVVLVHLIKDVRRQRRFLTFDVMFCITGATMFWATGVANFFQPMLTYSSNPISINDPCSFIPGVVNPDCGRIPNPLWVTVLETFMLLAAVLIVTAVVDRARRRNPGISRSKQCWLVYGVSLGLCVLEPLAIIPLHGWAWPGMPFSLFEGTMRYPIIPEILCFAGFVALPAFVRIFKDDKGRTVLERNMETYSPRKRTAVTFMALYFLMQFTVWMPATAPLWLPAFHQHQWVQLPPHLHNGLCDQAGSEKTVYGPCPGTPGYKMPLAGQPGTPLVHA